MLQGCSLTWGLERYKSMAPTPELEASASTVNSSVVLGWNKICAEVNSCFSLTKAASTSGDQTNGTWWRLGE